MNILHFVNCDTVSLWGVFMSTWCLTCSRQRPQHSCPAGMSMGGTLWAQVGSKIGPIWVCLQMSWWLHLCLLIWTLNEIYLDFRWRPAVYFSHVEPIFLKLYGNHTICLYIRPCPFTGHGLCSLPIWGPKYWNLRGCMAFAHFKTKPTLYRSSPLLIQMGAHMDRLG